MKASFCPHSTHYQPEVQLLLLFVAPVHSTNTDFNGFLSDFQKPARGRDPPEPLILHNPQVLAFSNALPTRGCIFLQITKKVMSYPPQLRRRERLQQSSSMRSQKVVAFIRCGHLFTVHGIRSCALFKPHFANAQTQRTLNMMFHPLIKCAFPPSIHIFFPPGPRVAAHACSNSNASANLMAPITKHAWNSCVVSYQHYQSCLSATSLSLPRR